MTRLASPLALAVFTFVSSVRADPVPAEVRLAWVRGTDADTCPDGQWMRGEVARRLRRDPFDDDGPRSIEAVVERTSLGWLAVLRVRDRAGQLLGERSLTHTDASCAPIADAAALAIALAVDPDATVDDPRPATTPAPAPTPLPRPRVRRVTPTRREAPTMPFTLGLAAGVSVGISPSISPFVGLAGGVNLTPRWSLRARLELSPAQPSDTPSFLFGYTRGTLTACGAAWDDSRFELAGCVGVTAAAVHASVRNDRALDAGDHPWVAAVAAVSFRWSPSPRWFVGVEAEGTGALVRSAFRLRPDASEITSQPFVGGGGALLVGLRAQ